MLKRDLNFIEVTLAHRSSSVNMLHICIRTPFLLNTGGELLLHIVVNVEVVNVKVLPKQVKSCSKCTSIL